MKTSLPNVEIVVENHPRNSFYRLYGIEKKVDAGITKLKKLRTELHELKLMIASNVEIVVEKLGVVGSLVSLGFKGCIKTAFDITTEEIDHFYITYEFEGEELDLRTNHFQEGEDDAKLETSKKAWDLLELL